MIGLKNPPMVPLRLLLFKTLLHHKVIQRIAFALPLRPLRLRGSLFALIPFCGHYFDWVRLRITNAMAKAMRAPIKPAGIPKIAM